MIDAYAEYAYLAEAVAQSGKSRDLVSLLAEALASDLREARELRRDFFELLLQSLRESPQSPTRRETSP